jgi:phospholipase A1
MAVQSATFDSANVVLPLSRPMSSNVKKIISGVLLLLLTCSVQAQPNCARIVDDDERLLCYDQQNEEPSSEKKDERLTVLEAREREEQSLFESSFGILPYRRSYLLPLTYVDDIDAELFADLNDENMDEGLDNIEIKFQYSFKVPIGRRFILGDDQLYFGFTQLSLWQAYNSNLSSPFRENNYQPELLWEIPLKEPVFNGKLNSIVLGLNHQSNGLGGNLSRSWNRITFDAAWADEDWAIGVRLWQRIPEPEDQDDNPDIDDFLGYGQLQWGYRWGDTRFTGIFYNNFEREDNHTSVDISFSMPISSKLRGFVQYFNGYGETLINYNRRTHRIGFGVVLSDWF